MNVRSKLTRFSIFVFVFFVFPVSASAELAVIANPAFASESATEDDIKRLYLGKARDVNGADAKPLDQDSNNSIHGHFYDTVVGKSASQLRAYWSRLVFTGKGKPPKELGDDAEIIAAVAGDETLIGYVDAAAVTGDVKVLLTIP